jgi:hypothetical protein
MGMTQRTHALGAYRVGTQAIDEQLLLGWRGRLGRCAWFGCRRRGGRSTGLCRCRTCFGVASGRRGAGGGGSCTCSRRGSTIGWGRCCCFLDDFRDRLDARNDWLTLGFKKLNSRDWF